MPVAEAREGDFNRIRPVFDPATTVGTPASFTRTQFPGNVVPKSQEEYANDFLNKMKDFFSV